MEVKPVPVEGADRERRERAIIDNISALGARVYASAPWHLGEQVEVTPAVGEAPLKAEVVYCHKQGADRFVPDSSFAAAPCCGPSWTK